MSAYQAMKENVTRRIVVECYKPPTDCCTLVENTLT